MYRFIKKAITAFILVALIVVTGVFAVFAESNTAGLHTPSHVISVYSPITDLIGIEINANVRFAIIPTVQCEDVLAVHQEQIDKILALVIEHDIDSLQDLHTLLQALQDEMPFSCPGGCTFIPAWVIIGGVRHPAFICTVCGRVIIIG